MSYTIKEEKSYPHSADTVQLAAQGAVEGLAGKIISQDKSAGRMEVQFDKKILGKVLGERTHMEIEIAALSEEESNLALLAYPLDALGRKLMFGARKGVTRTVLNWFIAHLEHRLPNKPNSESN
jgi:hypothetical protein